MDHATANHYAVILRGTVFNGNCGKDSSPNYFYCRICIFVRDVCIAPNVRLPLS
jgi:hypothetical protein